MSLNLTKKGFISLALLYFWCYMHLIEEKRQISEKYFCPFLASLGKILPILPQLHTHVVYVFLAYKVSLKHSHIHFIWDMSQNSSIYCWKWRKTGKYRCILTQEISVRNFCIKKKFFFLFSPTYSFLRKRVY